MKADDKRKKLRIIPPEDFFNLTSDIPNISEVRFKLGENPLLSKCFIIIYLNNPITRRGLLQELKRLGYPAYKEKATDILKRLQNLAVIEEKAYESIDHVHPSPLDKKIIAKHSLFLSKVFSAGNKNYHKMCYYFLTPLGEEILPFIAKKYNCCILEDEDES